MDFVVVGIKKVNRKSDGTAFIELHLLSQDKFIIGHRCDTVFVREDSIQNINALDLNVNVQVVYNRYGRVDSVVVLDSFS